MAIEHDYFGIVGDYWSETIEAGDQDVEVNVDADPESVSSDALDIAAAMISELEVLDHAVREAFVSELTSSGSPTSEYITALLSEVDEEILTDEIVRESGDKQIDVLRALHLLRVDIRPENNGDEESFAIFEYALAEDDTELRLTATMDSRGEVVVVSFEA